MGWVVKQEYNKPYTISGYTELRVWGGDTVKKIYRANDYFYGKGWYDWALVEDPNNSDILPHWEYPWAWILQVRNTRITIVYAHWQFDIDIDGRKKEDVIEAELKYNAIYMVVIGSKNVIGGDNIMLG